MAVGIITIGVLSLFAIVIAWTSLGPVIQELGTDIGSGWEDNPCGTNNTSRPDCVARDTTFEALLVLPLFMFVAVIAWIFLTLTRRDFGQV